MYVICVFCSVWCVEFNGDGSTHISLFHVCRLLLNYLHLSGFCAHVSRSHTLVDPLRLIRLVQSPGRRVHKMASSGGCGRLLHTKPTSSLPPVDSLMYCVCAVCGKKIVFD